MKSKKNLTRFTYEHTAFQGWRLCIARKGKVFIKYFSDKQFGGPRKALKAAESKLSEVKWLFDNNRLMNGQLSKTTVKKVNDLLA